jgi:ribosomal-protein-alanine N-acetyltransferase
MPTRPSRPTLVGERVYLRVPRKSDVAAFLAAARASRRLHGSWVAAPQTPAGFAAYVGRFGGRRLPSRVHAGYAVLRRDDDSWVGVFNFSEIVRGAFQNAYLGYYGFRANAGKGLMKEGLGLALDAAFGPLGLHRVEVNIQPGNVRSIGLVTSMGFAQEGFSRGYLRIAGRWRDHVRFAMLSEDWRAQKSAQRKQGRARLPAAAATRGNAERMR